MLIILFVLKFDYLLLHKASISVDKSTSEGSTIGNVLVRKFSHRYVNSKNSVEFVLSQSNTSLFQKNSCNSTIFSHLLVDIEKDGIDLNNYPANWTGNYIIAHGILGSRAARGRSPIAKEMW